MLALVNFAVLMAVPIARATLLCGDSGQSSENVDVLCDTDKQNNPTGQGFTLESADIIKAGKKANLHGQSVPDCGSISSATWNGGSWTVTGPALTGQDAVDVTIAGFTDGTNWLACSATADGFICGCA